MAVVRLKLKMLLNSWPKISSRSGRLGPWIRQRGSPATGAGRSLSSSRRLAVSRKACRLSSLSQSVRASSQREKSLPRREKNSVRVGAPTVSSIRKSS